MAWSLVNDRAGGTAETARPSPTSRSADHPPPAPAAAATPRPTGRTTLNDRTSGTAGAFEHLVGIDLDAATMRTGARLRSSVGPPWSHKHWTDRSLRSTWSNFQSSNECIGPPSRESETARKGTQISWSAHFAYRCN